MVGVNAIRLVALWYRLISGLVAAPVLNKIKLSLDKALQPKKNKMINYPY